MRWDDRKAAVTGRVVWGKSPFADPIWLQNGSDLEIETEKHRVSLRHTTRQDSCKAGWKLELSVPLRQSTDASCCSIQARNLFGEMRTLQKML
jgi:hypothetical protein